MSFKCPINPETNPYQLVNQKSSTDFIILIISSEEARQQPTDPPSPSQLLLSFQ